MRDKKISYDLQFRIKQYLEYYYRKQNTMDEEIGESISFLNLDLKNKLIFESNKIVLNESQIFRNNFS
jgi:hypothetical protein